MNTNGTRCLVSLGLDRYGQDIHLLNIAQIECNHEEMLLLRLKSQINPNPSSLICCSASQRRFFPRSNRCLQKVNYARNYASRPLILYSKPSQRDVSFIVSGSRTISVVPGPHRYIVSTANTHLPIDQNTYTSLKRYGNEIDNPSLVFNHIVCHQTVASPPIRVGYSSCKFGSGTTSGVRFCRNFYRNDFELLRLALQASTTVYRAHVTLESCAPL